MEIKSFTDVPVNMKLVFYSLVLISCVCLVFYSSENIVQVSGRISSIITGTREITKEIKEDQEDTLASCPLEKAHLAPDHSLPNIALFSFPGSGNTWVRHLIESATGIYTGSIYRDRSLLKGGFKGECQDPECGCTSVVKMHHLPKYVRHVPAWQRCILLMRNPYDALISEMNRKSSKPKGGDKHTGHAKESNFTGEAWNNYVKRQTASWSRTFEQGVSFFNYTQIIHYEDLKADLETHLRTLLRFIIADTNSSVLDASELRFQCTLDNSKGNFKRKKTKMTFDPFTKELRAVVDEKIRYVMNKLSKMGHPLPPYANDYLPL